MDSASVSRVNWRNSSSRRVAGAPGPWGVRLPFLSYYDAVTSPILTGRIYGPVFQSLSGVFGIFPLSRDAETVAKEIDLFTHARRHFSVWFLPVGWLCCFCAFPTPLALCLCVMVVSAWCTLWISYFAFLTIWPFWGWSKCAIFLHEKWHVPKRFGPGLVWSSEGVG